MDSTQSIQVQRFDAGMLGQFGGIKRRVNKTVFTELQPTVVIGLNRDHDVVVDALGLEQLAEVLNGER